MGAEWPGTVQSKHLWREFPGNPGLGLDTFIVKGPGLILVHWATEILQTVCGAAKNNSDNTHTTHKHKTHEGEKMDVFY